MTPSALHLATRSALASQRGGARVDHSREWVQGLRCHLNQDDDDEHDDGNDDDDDDHNDAPIDDPGSWFKVCIGSLNQGYQLVLVID